MYNTKDIQFVGKYDFDKEEAMKYAGNLSCETFSVGIFKWVMKNSVKKMKRGKVEVRVAGKTSQANLVFLMAENVVKLLDDNEWDGRKTVIVKS